MYRAVKDVTSLSLSLRAQWVLEDHFCTLFLELVDPEDGHTQRV